MPEILKTKLFIPRMREKIVPRQRLVELLNTGLDKKLILITAPAGFGKTTLVVSWLKQIGHSTAWLSLDEADNELPRFLTYLAATLQLVDEQFGAPLLSAIQSPQLPAIETVLTDLLNEFALGKDPLILVLDDFHLLTDPAILNVMEFLLHHQPPQLHLVITTREDPALPLARLRAKDQITEIRARDLRFTQEETEGFFRGVMGIDLSTQDVALLDDRTEGWAVGLQLAGLSMQKQADLKSFIADFSGSNRYILDYLTDEVLQQQPESVRSFLLETAILDRLNGSLCDALTGRNDSDELLAHLEAANLFVIPLDEERRWYRYHHLFSDLLHSQLTRLQPERIPELHRRASHWFEGTGDIQAAVLHALQASDLPRAGHLIGQHAIPELYHGEVTMVVGWFDQLPDEILEVDPMLCISKAWALVLMQRSTRTTEVAPALRAAAQALDRVSAAEELRNLVAGHTASVQAFLLRQSPLVGETPKEVIAISQNAQQLLPEQEKGIRSVNSLNMGYAYLALADLPAAKIAYEHTLRDGLAGGNLYAAMYGPLNLGVIALLAGRLNEALELCETNIELFNKFLAGLNFPPIGGLYVLKACILLESNRLAEAEPVLMEGLDLIRWTGEYEAHFTGYTALARLRAIQGNRPAMLKAIKTLEEVWPEGIFYGEALHHRLLMRYWYTDTDVQKDSLSWLSRSGMKFGNMPVIKSVDPLSTAHVESYLGAAHVLARLANSHPHAYPLEDVQPFLERQEEFAKIHGFISWVVKTAIARALLYQAGGKKDEALKALEVALIAAAPTGLIRVFADECEPLQGLLEEIIPRLKEQSLIDYSKRLLEVFSCGPMDSEKRDRVEALLSERELEVLCFLAKGLTYQEIGRQLFLSLNTVQFHVKNIYGKLLVNKRVQAIEKARELNLI